MLAKTIRGMSWGIILAGLALIATPFVMDFSGLGSWNSVVVGVLAVLLGSIREWGNLGRSWWASWLTVLLGIWMAVSPYVVGFSGEIRELWFAVISGVVLLALSAGATGEDVTPPRFHRAL